MRRSLRASRSSPAVPRMVRVEPHQRAHRQAHPRQRNGPVVTSSRLRGSGSRSGTTPLASVKGAGVSAVPQSEKASQPINRHAGPSAGFSAGELRDREANPTQFACLAVYDGQRCIGHIAARQAGRRGLRRRRCHSASSRSAQRRRRRLRAMETRMTFLSGSSTKSARRTKADVATIRERHRRGHRGRSTDDGEAGLLSARHSWGD